jgi:hypothetical protein
VRFAEFSFQHFLLKSNICGFFTVIAVIRNCGLLWIFHFNHEFSLEILEATREFAKNNPAGDIYPSHWQGRSFTTGDVGKSWTDLLHILPEESSNCGRNPYNYLTPASKTGRSTVEQWSGLKLNSANRLVVSLIFSVGD